MLDAADLEPNLLDFVQKSFGFARLVEFAGTEFAVFQRTETESEAKFRPRILKLSVLVPRGWLVLDPVSDLIRVASDGHTPGPHASGTAVETAAEKTAFVEQGVDWRRADVASVGLVYVPEAWADRLFQGKGPEALRSALGPA